MKILHIIDSLGIGGAEKLLLGSINSLREHENHLVVLREPESLRKDLSPDCRYTNLGMKDWRQLRSKSRVVRQYIRDNKIDLVHCHLYWSNILARMATPKKIPVFNSIHAISSMASYRINKKSLWLERITYRKRHSIIAVSQEVLKDFDEWIGIKGDSHVLYNFIDDKFFQSCTASPYKPGDPLRLVAVGNLRWQKNYPYLVESFKKLPDGVSLDIYGEGDLRKGFQEEIDKHHLQIRLCGTRDDLRDVLPQYDLFVMSSFYEGQPVSLLEAMACGLPVMLSDIPVLKEVTGGDAIYFNIGDPEDFVNKIKEVINGAYDLAALARRGRERVERIARRSNYVEKLEGIYRGRLRGEG